MTVQTPETIQIRVTTPGGFIHEGIKYSEGDVSTEPYAIGYYFVAQAGWAEDTSGQVTKGSPSTTETILFTQDTSTQPNIII
jgi:hypothetical protein